MKLKLSVLIGLSLCISIIAGCQSSAADSYGLEGKTHSAVTPEHRASVKGWMDRHKQVLDRVAQGNVDMILVGDSITRRWEDAGKAVWDQYYAPRNAVNLGFGGDRTQHVLWRLNNGEIDGIGPKLAILMIGTNNSNRDDNTAEEIADGIKAIVAALRTRLPKTKVLVLGIFPRGNAEQRKAKVAATYNEQWAKNDKASELVSKIADNKHVFYLNINKSFLDAKGNLGTDVMPDMLHLNEKGYQIWAEAMESTVKKLMSK
jgi:beta-glucosidase